MYRAPPWPLFCLHPNSICILVTSGGRIAAPGPSLMERSYGNVNCVVVYLLMRFLLAARPLRLAIIPYQYGENRDLQL
jgi:hypothetical protein